MYDKCEITNDEFILLIDRLKPEFRRNLKMIILGMLGYYKV